MARYEPLTSVDANFLYWETPTTPMNMGNVSIFEGDPFFDSSGVFRLSDARRAVESRLHLVPRYRTKLMEVPFGAGHPVLVDDPDFDIANHVRLIALPKPGSTDQLKEAFSRAHEGMLDRTKPLWEFTFVEGLEAGRVALIQKTHHGLIDGISSMDVMTVLFDRERDTPRQDPTPWQPEPPPDSLELAREMFEKQVQVSLDSAAHGPYGVGQYTAEQLEELTKALQSMSDLGPLPKTSLNGPIGPRRRYDWISSKLDEVKGLRRLVPGATVNDVMISIVAGGLRALLSSRGEDVDALQLRAFIPVSLRQEEERGSWGGNRVSGFITPLPVAESDETRRLEAVHQATKTIKESKQAVGIHFLTQLQGFAPPMLMAQAGRQAMQQSTFANLTITNVPGPQTEIYFMGAKLLELHPQVLIGNQLTLNVAIMSYNGALSIGLCADRDRNPDLEVMKTGIEQSLAALQRLSRDAS